VTHAGPGRDPWPRVHLLEWSQRSFAPLPDGTAKDDVRGFREVFRAQQTSREEADVSDVSGVVADLAAEHEALDAVVAALTPDQWSTATPAQGWDVRDSISHLAYFDDKAVLALTDPVAFAAHVEELLASGFLGEGDVALGRATGAPALLEHWRTGRSQLLEVVRAADPGQRVPWYGPAMSLRSFVTARLMETWAHGVDVRDAVGAEIPFTERLRNVCHLCVGARAFSFVVHGETDPGDPVRVEVTGPAGEVWSWGPDGAADRVSGPALDLALLVTQRRHRADTRLQVEGPVAEKWLSIAQAFAGPAGTGRAPLEVAP
jgi:uncharacterized protein (TIGR03084 family)